jgi:hypothetical protein
MSEIKQENTNRPKGIKTFPKRENSPDFVLGDMILTPNDFFKWVKEKEQHLTEYTDKDGKTHKQLKFQIKNGDYGVYLELNTWKPDNKKSEQIESDGDLPF